MEKVIKDAIKQGFNDFTESLNDIAERHITEEYKYQFAWTEGYEWALTELCMNKQISEETLHEYMKKTF